MSVNPASTAKAAPISAQSGGTPFRLKPIAVQRLAAVVFVAFILAAWQIASGMLPAVLMPSPLRVWGRFQSIWTDPVFLGFALTTLWHVVVCVSLAFLLGVGLAVLTYFVPALHRALYGRLTPFLNSFSGLGWAFLAVVWFGVTHGSVLFAATVALLPFAVINAGAGLRELNQETVEMSVSFSRSRMRRTLLVILPMLVPYLFATLRLCSAIGWHIVPTAELLTGAGGIGTLISIARQRFWTDMIFAIALLDVIMVLVTDRLLFARLQKKMKNYYVA
jgi:ABC-type nitrate/sulfonate/bicarbonate transport system permease component